MVHDGVFLREVWRWGLVFETCNFGGYTYVVPVCKTLVAFSGFFLYNYKYATKSI